MTTQTAPVQRGQAATSVTVRLDRADAAIGRGAEFSGMCERFVRTCFGFAARYPSARQAWEATTRRRSGEAPAGVPVFWDITTGVNKDFDHVAISVGGGWCVSTSAGPTARSRASASPRSTAQWPARDLPITSAHTSAPLQACTRTRRTVGADR